MTQSATRLLRWCSGALALTGWLAVASAADPLGYPGSIGDDDRGAEPFSIPDDLRPRGGLDPARAPPFEEADPDHRLAWFIEPFGPSPCDRNLVDPAWMGPGEYAYHKSPGQCWCTRDHTRMFRMGYMGTLWSSMELLLWATSADTIPPLATASPAGTAPASAGIIGQPGTSILFGGGDAPGTLRPGGRFTVGVWFDPRQLDGIEASYLELALARPGVVVGNADGALLARPYVDSVTGAQAALVVPFPGAVPADPALLAQSIQAGETSLFNGAEVLLRHSLVCDLFHRRYVVGGYRYFGLIDRLGVSQTNIISTGTPGGFPQLSVGSVDQFNVVNQFHGGEFGLIERWWHHRWGLQATGKVGFGATGIGTSINGLTQATQTVQNADGTTTSTLVSSTPGGVLAQPTNSGSTWSSVFAAVGEVGVAVDYGILPQLRCSVGYTCIWWSQVARAGEQVDPAVNPSQFPPGTLVGPPAPTFQLRTTDFWAQGLTLGLEYVF
ncbi:MAG: BBP7 family outer membrane beta-barrel protein [Planctomycetaceae bacterium]